MSKSKSQPALLLLVLLICTSLSCAQCDDGENRGDGWQFDEGSDAGTDTDTGTDTGPSGPRCEFPPPLADDGDSQTTMFAANAGLGIAFGHTQRASSWGRVNIGPDGSVELGPEHPFYEDEGAELIDSGKRAYLLSFVEPRVIVFDPQREFEVVADYNLDLPDWLRTDDGEGRPVYMAAFNEYGGRHYFGFAGESVLAVVDACADDPQAADVDYIDLADQIGDGWVVTKLFGDTLGSKILGTVVRRGERALFSLDTITLTVDDVDTDEPGVQLHQLPEPTIRSHFVRMDDDTFVISVGRGTANQGIAGGLLRLGDQTSGYAPGDYIVRAEDLGGNPQDFVMLDENRGVAVIESELGLENVYFEIRDNGSDIMTVPLDSPAVHICSLPDTNSVWFPTTNGIFRITDGVFDQPPTELDEQFEVIPHHCMFER